MAVKTVADVSSNGHATVALRELQKPLSRQQVRKGAFRKSDLACVLYQHRSYCWPA